MNAQECLISPSEYAAAAYARGVEWCLRFGVSVAFLRVVADTSSGRFIFRPDGWHHYPEKNEGFTAVSVVFPSEDLMREAGLRDREYFIEYLD